MTSADVLLTMNQDRVISSRTMRPFDHQVAGQSVMLHYNETTICKCLVHREYQFYQVMPKCMLPFVPEFQGVIQLYVPESNSQDCPIGCSCSRCLGEGVHLDWSPGGCTSSDERISGYSLDPRRLRVLQKTTRMAGADINENLYYFMLLEDLMARYRNPCILDLKMGVRQHGDDAPPDKVAYQTKKCLSTTSSSLGLRLCGMKRYNVVSDEFETRDRMYGRQLSEEEVKSEIVKFLFNGIDFRTDLITSILRQLEDLKRVIEQLDGYRFYSSSLLIIYEGAIAQEQISQELRRESDHGSEYVVNSQIEKHENILYSGDNTVSDNVDSECSIQRTVVIDDNSVDVCSNEAFDTSECSSEQRQQRCSAENVRRNQYDNASSENQDASFESTNSLSTQKHLQSVDIKVVDFAHATFDGFLDGTVKHCGPDHGFLVGVNTLLEIFTELKDRC